jgi:Protein of unknown function (DUF5672)
MTTVLILLFLFALIIYYMYRQIRHIEPFYNAQQYTAIIVEPRKHKALEFVISNFLQNLDDNWNVILFHGTDNETFAQEIAKKINTSRLGIVNLHVGNLTIEDYNKLLMSDKLLSQIPTEVFLVFQTDTIICRNHREFINKFIQYDYVGAPWTQSNVLFPNDTSFSVGNGGLSLRRKSKMREILNKCQRIGHENEDVFFARGCDAVRPHKPDGMDAKEFAIEHVYNKTTFGHHKSWLYHDQHIVDEFKQTCPGYATLVKLNQ